MPDREWGEEFAAFANEVRRGAVEKIAGSDAFISLVPEGEVDIKFAVELGLAIMFDKPIIAVAMPGRTVPPGLARIAHRIVECDLDTEEGQQKFRAAIREVAEGE